LRLAEAAGVLSLATDLAMGQPLGHGLRTAMLALRAARAMSLPEAELVTVYYTGLLHFAGCTAESQTDARFFGDELAARPRMLSAQFGSRRELIATTARVAHRDSPAVSRAVKMVRSSFGGVAEFRKWASSHCDMARLLGARMGLSGQVQESLRHLYERWDGKGMPGDLRGEQIPLAVRLMQVAQDADIARRHGGPEFARQVLASRAGAGLDPRAVREFLALGEDLFAGLDAPSVWEDAIAAEPGPRPVAVDERIEDWLSAVADFADMKSMFTVGHSRAVAELAGASAGIAGLPAAEVRLVRWSALVHDIGRVCVPLHVWVKPGPLTQDERERVRLHCYHSERVLDAAGALRPLAKLAGAHGERYDGSGYHRGCRGDDLPLSAWLLAAADCYQAMQEPRAHRPALTEAAAVVQFGADMAAGRIGPVTAAAVLTAADQRPLPVMSRPAGLSERECDVLGLLAKGLSTRQVARKLGISATRCGHDLRLAYGKAGVSTRAGATLFALEHRLVDSVAA
jgi:HD-GYP domain-containing protein (c-di-GMP phosphodiesterase class II)